MITLKEQPLPQYGACNLSSINLSEYVLNSFAKNAYFDFINFEKDIFVYVEAMDDIVTENSKLHALKEQRDFSINYRNIGIGIMGIADMLVKLGLIYGSKEANKLLDKIGNTLFRHAVIASSELAKKRGVFPKYSSNIWNSDIIKNHFNDTEIKILQKNGLRNASLLSIAPTGSIGTMLNVSTGIEPFFALSYTRKTVSLNNEETYYQVDLPIVEEFNNSEISYKKEILITSDQINWKNRIDTQATLQKHIDTAISSTINLPEETTLEDIEQLYLYAWKSKLKGITIFRTGSRKPILSTKHDNQIITKRPDILDAKVIRFKNREEDWIAVIGLVDDIPYEIFTGKVDTDEFPIPKSITNGKIIKVRLKDGTKRYDFQYTDKYGYDNCLGGLSRVFNKEYWNYAKLISALLREKIEISKIIKIIDGLNLDSEILNTWKNGVKRALKSFIKDGEISHEKCPECGATLIYEGGCTSCKSCGFSKCG